MVALVQVTQGGGLDDDGRGGTSTGEQSRYMACNLSPCPPICIRTTTVLTLTL